MDNRFDTRFNPLIFHPLQLNHQWVSPDTDFATTAVDASPGRLETVPPLAKNHLNEEPTDALRQH
jgi:hypothetical protein